MQFIQLAVIAFIFIGCSVNEDALADESMLDQKEPVLYSTTIDKDMALQNLHDFMDTMDENSNYTRNSLGMQRKKIVSHISVGNPVNPNNPAMLKTRSADGEEHEVIEPYYHVFNFENDEVFAVMSGDKRLPPLFAITEKGYFDPTQPQDNPGLEDFVINIERYYDDMLSGDVGDINHDPETGNPGVLIEKDDGSGRNKQPYREETVYEYKTNYYPSTKDGKAAGLVKAKWRQGRPFNYYAPFTGYINDKAGCVAIAMAQVMSAHQWPNEYICHMNARESYNWLESKSPTDEHARTFETIIGKDPEAVRVRLDWGLINTAQNGKDSPKEDIGSDMRASLIRDIGYKLGNHWGLGGTSAHVRDTKGTFPRFGYKYGVEKHHIRLDRLFSEIKSGYPCLVGGFTATKIEASGHVWVAHGLMEVKSSARVYRVYEDGTRILSEGWGYGDVMYVLYNFGWGGTADGYYLAGVYDPGQGPVYEDPEGGGGASGSKYNSRNRFVWNIRPDR